MKLSITSITSVAVIFAFFLALTSYTNSSLLFDIFKNDQLVNLAFTLGGVFSISHLFILAHAKKTKLVFVGSFVLLLSALVCLVFNVYKEFSLVFAVMYLGLGTGLLYLMDLLVEEKTPQGETGTIRGRYMAFTNTAWVVAPLCAGFITDNLGGRIIIYCVAIVLLLVIITAISTFKNIPTLALPSKPPQPSAYTHHKRVSAFINTLLLNSFYAFMVIGMPLYLTQVAGWNWSQIGITFTAMLLMFPLIQLPLGKYLDTHKREFRLISGVSLALMGISFIGILVVAPISYIFASLLFITSRIGAATLEVTTDTAFFDTVTDKEKGLIAWYRALVPISYTLVPLSSFLITNYTLRVHVFVISMCLVGLYYGLSRVFKIVVKRV